MRGARVEQRRRGVGEPLLTVKGNTQLHPISSSPRNARNTTVAQAANCCASCSWRAPHQLVRLDAALDVTAVDPARDCHTYGSPACQAKLATSPSRRIEQCAVTRGATHRA